MTKRKGRFELADGGTLFLDEIGDLSVDLQVKLLRVLQEKEFEPLGSTHTLRVDVRVVAATNRDLLQMVDDGCFRPDLYYRLSVFPISLPPLRNRPGDIPSLARHFVAKYAGRMNKPLQVIQRKGVKVDRGRARHALSESHSYRWREPPESNRRTPQARAF